MAKHKYSEGFRQAVLLEELDKTYRALERELYFQTTRPTFKECEGEIDFGEEIVWRKEPEKNHVFRELIHSNKYLDCAERLVLSQRRKKARIKEKTKNIVLSDYGLFVTLTFNDKTLEKTDRVKRRRLVQRYLKDNCRNYVANIDFGKENGREHYHALTDSALKLENWHKYGAIKVEHIRATEKSAEKVPQYIAKLTNHAIKESAQGIRLIYSRKPKQNSI